MTRRWRFGDVLRSAGIHDAVHRSANELDLYTHQQHLDAFHAVGLDVRHDNEGGSPAGGLYVGETPSRPA